MLEQHQRLSDDIREQDRRGAGRARARDAASCATDKADRTALASLLNEMAMRLTNEFRLPGAEDGGQWLSVADRRASTRQARR